MLSIKSTHVTKHGLRFTSFISIKQRQTRQFDICNIKHAQEHQALTGTIQSCERFGISVARSSSIIYFKPIQGSESEIQREMVKLKMIDGYSSLMQI